MYQNNNEIEWNFDNEKIVYIGDSGTFVAGIFSPDASDFSSFTAYMKIVDDIDDPEVRLEYTGVALDASNWIFEVPVTDTSIAAGTYPTQCWIDDGAGDIRTFIDTNFTFKKNPRHE